MIFPLKRVTTTKYLIYLPSHQLLPKILKGDPCQSFSKYISQLIHFINIWSNPIYPLRYHSLVCIKNSLFIVGMGPIRNKEPICIFRFFFFCLYV